MEIEKLSSSTVIVSTNDCKILCDPWIENGEYYGSWSLVEEVDKEKSYKKMDECEFIYISHIHPDHFSKKTLKNLSKEKKIIIHKYATPFLKKNLEILGFEKIIEIAHGEIINLKKETNFIIYAADNCDPNICKKFVGCNYSDDDVDKKSHQIDTCAVIADKTETCLNLNDCYYDLMKSTIGRIKEDLKKIDILLVNYNSAHSFPQNIINISEDEKIRISNELKKLSLERSKCFIKDFNPKYFVPFAGEYIISGKNFSLNKYKGVNSQRECYEYFISSEYKNKLVMLNYGNKFNSDNGNYKFSIDKEKTNYEVQKNIMKNIKYEYEFDSEPKEDEIVELANKAFIRYSAKIKDQKLDLNHSLFIKFFGKYIMLNLKEIKFSIASKVEQVSKYYQILELDERLLIRLLKGPKYAHWNNADIGSHIFYTKSDIREFDNKVWTSLAYFHA